jgi:hypothetical protein
MRQLNVLNDNEWMGWLQWMRTSFEQGAILDYWKNSITLKNSLILHSEILSTVR